MKNKKTNNQIDTALTDRKITRLGQYAGTRQPLLWECDICSHQWTASPDNVINKQSGCKKCSLIKRSHHLSNEEIDNLIGTRCIIRLDDCTGLGINRRILWKCITCSHIWLNLIKMVVHKNQGCVQCYKQPVEFQQTEMEKKFNKRNLHLKSTYINANTKVSAACITCGYSWTPYPVNVLNNNSGCPRCVIRQHSKPALHWLTTIASELDISIQHAGNIGEYVVPGTKYKVDGYCRETNTIYEFYGDYWHGNLNKFDPTKIHPQLHVTYEQVYQRTVNREKLLVNMGYVVVSMWESQWKLMQQKLKERA